MGMPAMIELGVARVGIDHVVGSHDQSDIRGLELPVDLVQVEELGVGHVGLGEEHVHMPGHSPRHRVDGELHVNTALLKQIGELANVVLSLGDREAVTGDDDHRLGVGEHHGGLLRVHVAHRLALCQG